MLRTACTAGDNSWQQLTPEQSHAYAAAWQQQQQQGFVDPSFMQQVAYYSHQWSAGGYGVSGAAGGATAAAGAGQAVAQVSTHNQQYTVPADGYSPYNTNTGGPTAAPATTTYTPSGHVQEQVPFSGYTTMQQTQFAGLQCAGPNFISMQHQQYSAGQAAAWHEAYSMQQPHSGPQYNQPHASDHPQLYSHQAAAAAARQSRFPATDASPFLYEQQRQQQKSAKKKKARQQFSNTKSASAGRKQQQQQQNPLAAMCSVPEAEGGAGVPESSAQTVPRPSQTENNCQQEQQQRPMTLLEKAGSTIALAFPKQGDAPTAADSVTPQLVLPAAPQEQEVSQLVHSGDRGLRAQHVVGLLTSACFVYDTVTIHCRQRPK